MPTEPFAYEVWLRLGAFGLVLLLMLSWEQLAPKRQAKISKWRRWRANFGLVVVNTLVLRLLIPAGAVGAAAYAQQHQFGLFNSFQLNQALPGLAIVIAVICLDAIIYWQHRLFHRIPLLWRLHRVHHADIDFDVSTGLRFHPLEIIISMLIKIIAVLALGISPLAVIIFEVILNASSMFNHGNVALPRRIEPWVRKLIVTQDMHRIHHSRAQVETDSNFGFNLSIWDRLFGSYTARAEKGPDGLEIGLDEYPSEASSTPLWQLLKIPFTKPKSDL